MPAVPAASPMHSRLIRTTWTKLKKTNIVTKYGKYKIWKQRNKNISDKNKDKFIITLGMNGAKHDNIVFLSPSPKQTIDVSGAGDTFTAFFSLKYYETKNISESIKFANQMASIVVSKRGVATP